MSALVVDTGALGWNLLLSTTSRGAGEAKLSWTNEGKLNQDFILGVESPGAALENILLRVEKNGAVSPLDIPGLVGVIVGHIQRRA